MMKPKLTILTPTYNRADTLVNAYDSLKNQTCFDFDWFVVDNGSTDRTEDLFEKWCKEENQFKIYYHKIKERGIPRALNYGIKRINSKYFFRLDSDDKLLPNCVEELYKGIAQIDNKDDFVGAGYVITLPNGMPVKGVWPKVNDNGYVDCTNLERNKYDLDADMREVYKTDIVKKYEFPVWEDEIFAPEQLNMDAMALDGYKIRWFNVPVYTCNYLDDGLTKGNWDLLRNNKMGYAMLSNQSLLYLSSFKEKFKSAAQHIALSIVAGYPSYILKSNDKLMTLLALPYGLLLSIRRRNQFKYDDPVNRRNF